VDWAETPLFQSYKQCGEEIMIDPSLFSEKQLDELLDEMKANYDEYRDNVDNNYQKALNTLKFLLKQQNSLKFEKIKELYSEVTLENTLKLMIRCKLAYESRKKVLQMFRSIHFYE
jgi:hypothetical protein